MRALDGAAIALIGIAWLPVAASTGVTPRIDDIRYGAQTVCKLFANYLIVAAVILLGTAVAGLGKELMQFQRPSSKAIRLSHGPAQPTPQAVAAQSG